MRHRPTICIWYIRWSVFSWRDGLCVILWRMTSVMVLPRFCMRFRVVRDVSNDIISGRLRLPVPSRSASVDRSERRHRLCWRVRPSAPIWEVFSRWNTARWCCSSAVARQGRLRESLRPRLPDWYLRWKCWWSTLRCLLCFLCWFPPWLRQLFPISQPERRLCSSSTSTRLSNWNVSLTWSCWESSTDWFLSTSHGRWTPLKEYSENSRTLIRNLLLAVWCWVCWFSFFLRSTVKAMIQSNFCWTELRLRNGTRLWTTLCSTAMVICCRFIWCWLSCWKCLLPVRRTVAAGVVVFSLLRFI